MLLKSLNATNSQGSVLNFPLDDISGGFTVKKIEGLDPVKATLVSSSFANQDGEQYHTSKREPRNIKIKLGLNPDYGIESVMSKREQLYSYFMPKSLAILGFHLFDKFAVSVFVDHLDVQIPGRVETFECDPFVEEPEADISLMCFNPDFYNPNLVTFDGMTVADLTESVLSYVGSVETGVTFTINPDRDLDAFSIYHRPSDNLLRTSDVSYPLLAGDILKITSIVGSKSVRLTRAGVETSILYAQSPQSNWLTLQPGDNNIRVYSDGAPIPFSIEYTAKYGGL